MGVNFSCPLSNFDDLDTHFKNIISRSISFASKEERTALRSVSFNGRDSDPVLLKPFGCKKMVRIEGSLSFKGTELSTEFSLKSCVSDVGSKAAAKSTAFRGENKEDQSTKFGDNPEKNSTSERHNAAVKLQKVYKSFRTRRQLADCAVLVEQRWWKLLDFAELKRSSISFFDIGKPETAISRWSRARKRAAKVGKGLSKDAKARKLALQHWLEAIDPRHRYGHNLQFYYAKWLQCHSRQPFFYWLDIGEGKEISLERCPRSKLQQQCIKYLGPAERKAHEVVLEDGKFVYKQSGKILNTTEGPKDAKWIFVLSVSKTLYVAQKNKGTFQHSSFLAGGATLSAGRLVVEKGVLQAVWPHSGHYLPTEENFQEFMSFLREHDVDLSDVKESPSEDEEEAEVKSKKGHCGKVRGSHSDAHLLQDTDPTNIEKLGQDCETEENTDLTASRLSRGLRSKIKKLKIPSRSDMFAIFNPEAFGPSCTRKLPTNSPEDKEVDDGYETAEDSCLTEEDFMVPKVSFFDTNDAEREEEEEEEIIPKEKIMKRIDSHKGNKSYQLAQHLTSKWTTGAGPRISCIKDYPPELQFRILEQANLSPRNRSSSLSPRNLLRFSPPDSLLQREAMKSCLGPPLATP